MTEEKKTYVVKVVGMFTLLRTVPLPPKKLMRDRTRSHSIGTTYQAVFA